MQSPLKKIIVYDLETGGLLSEYNSITEIAMVAVDLETLQKIDKFSIMLKPRIKLNMDDDSTKESKDLYKRLGSKNVDSGIKTLTLGSEEITLKNIDVLAVCVEDFRKMCSEKYPKGVLNDIDILNEIKNGDFKDIVKLYLSNSYNKEALDVTKMTLKQIFTEGVSYEEAFKQCNDFIKKHTVGNNKPIMAGHNVGWLPRRIVKGKEVKPNGFDNPFMEKFFKENGSDFFNSINNTIFDTLQMARIKFTNLPSYSLGVVANEMGMTLKTAHRALPDTIANADVLIGMLRNLRGSGGDKDSYKRRKFKIKI